MGSPYATDLLYHKEFTALAAQNPNFTYLTAISRERQADGAPPMYVQDRITASPAALMPILESDRGLVYVCGIAGMELGIFQKMATTLQPAALSRFLAVDETAMTDIKGWERKMINKAIRPTRRMFLEVY
jgi:sulfite reductase alpha subunit-like flavoprotein